LSGFKVLVTDHIYPSLDYEVKKLGSIGAELLEASSVTEEDLIKEAEAVDAVITCYAEITGRVIKAMKKCKIIAKTGIGVNNIDLDTATTCGIRVTNVPDYCLDEVSDHALALIMSLVRKIPFIDSTVKKGSWSFEEYRPIFRLGGKTLGLVGYGKIAQLLAEKVRPLKIKVIAYDPFVPQEVMQQAGVEKADLDDLLQQADYISLHAPLTPLTAGIIDERALSLVKPTAILVNTSRGQLIDEAALYRALKENRLAGAGLDVMATEKYDSANPLFSADGVVITAHSAFYSVEATQELREKVVDEVIRALTGQAAHYLVNKNLSQT